VARLSQLVHPLVPWAETLYAFGREQDPALVVTSVRRSFGEQARLYQRYLDGLSGGIPAAPPGHSMHERGLAFDLARPTVDPFQDDLLALLGAVWKAWGGVWKAVDPVHFQV
jgi:hypothetical protein